MHPGAIRLDDHHHDESAITGAIQLPSNPDEAAASASSGASSAASAKFGPQMPSTNGLTKWKIKENFRPLAEGFACLLVHIGVLAGGVAMVRP